MSTVVAGVEPRAAGSAGIIDVDPPNHSPRYARQGGMASLEPGARLLVIAGLVVLLYGLLLGVPLAAARSSSSAAPRALVSLHLEMLMSGTMLLALAAVVQLTGLDGGVGVVGAAILVSGVGLLGVGGTLNWRQGVDDQFARRSAGWRCNAIAGPTVLAGFVAVAIGVVGTW